MKTKEKKQTQVTFMLNDEVVEIIDRYAKTLGLSRSQMVRNMVMCGLQDAKVLKAIGVMDVVGLIRSMSGKPTPILVEALPSS